MAVSIIGSPSVSDAFLTIGDADTAFAAAFSDGWPIKTLADSRTSPERFTFHSSNPRVALVGPTGLLEARGVGMTLLSATYENVESPTMRVSVSPPVVELHALPETINATTGDSITITVTALDSAGKSVAGVVFGLSPDTSYWAVTSRPREGDWRLETPLVLHLRANQAGLVHLTAYSYNDRPERQRIAHPVAVTVHDP